MGNQFSFLHLKDKYMFMYTAMDTAMDLGITVYKVTILHRFIPETFTSAYTILKSFS